MSSNIGVPSGLSATSARMLVEKADDTWRTVALVLRQRCDQLIAAKAQGCKNETTFAIPIMLPGMPLFIDHKDKIAALLIDSLTQDGFTAELVQDNLVYINWSKEEVARNLRRKAKEKKERLKSKRG